MKPCLISEAEIESATELCCGNGRVHPLRRIASDRHFPSASRAGMALLEGAFKNVRIRTLTLTRLVPSVKMGSSSFRGRTPGLEQACDTFASSVRSPSERTSSPRLATSLDRALQPMLSQH